MWTSHFPAAGQRQRDNQSAPSHQEASSTTQAFRQPCRGTLRRRPFPSTPARRQEEEEEEREPRDDEETGANHSSSRPKPEPQEEREFNRARADRRKALGKIAAERVVARKRARGTFAQAWLQTLKALPAASSQQEAQARPFGLIARAHASHMLFTIGGFIACLSCGRAGSTKVGDLDVACKRFCRKGSGIYMRKLWKGQLPSGFKGWPDGIGNHAERAVFRVDPAEIGRVA